MKAWKHKDWEWQLANTLDTAEKLQEYMVLAPGEKAAVNVVSRVYKTGVSPFLAGRMKNPDAREPLRQQFLPNPEELRPMSALWGDPLEEGRFSPVKGVIHKYPAKAALVVTGKCFAYCRHCTRKNTRLQEDRELTARELEAAFDYIAKTPAIKDVLITGGDPFTLTDEALDRILSALRSIPHVSTLRIGTRSVVAAPMRITEKLADTIKKYHPVWINIQCNHWAEISPEMEKACDLLLSRGIPLGNQSVLLKGINNNRKTMEALLLRLIQLRVRPYYLYQCDPVKGTGHFMTPYNEGILLLRSLLGHLPGYALPRFIVDTPGKGGKIPVDSGAVLEAEEGRMVLRDYEGDKVELHFPD